MPAQTAKTGLLARAGAKLVNALNAHKGAPVEMDTNSGLPPGIENGVAEVVDLRFGEFREGQNKGQPFFIAAAVVKAPAEHDGVPVEGLRTQIGPEPLCDTPNARGKRRTYDDHLGWIRNELLKLGLNIDQFTGTPAQVEASILAGMKAIVDAGTHTRFRTWKGKPTDDFPDPRTNHVWNGAVAYNGQLADDVKDDGAGTDAADAGTGADGDAPAAEFNEFGWDELVERWEGLDEGHEKDEVCERLVEMAVAAGVDKKTAEEAEGWAEVKEMMDAAGGGEDPADEEPFLPVKDGVYGCMVAKDPKNPKKGRRKAEVIVTKVDKKAETVEAKDNDTKKPVVDAKGKPRAIPWADLIVE